MSENSPTISLCMIARDEEKWIAQAIQSVKPVVSEIILVDTGSQDRTIEIAKELGAQVFLQPWSDDFSAARNLSLEKATSDWILVLDADEVIDLRDHDQLKHLTLKKVLCYEFLQRHYTNDQRLSGFRPVRGEYPQWEGEHGGYFESNLVRLFPNHDGIEYRGKVHELVEHSIWEINKHTIVRTKIPIHHYGHTKIIQRTKDKSSIYTPLGQAKIEETPGDWKVHFEMGVECNRNGFYDQSINAFVASIELNHSYVPTWVNIGYVFCEVGKYDDAMKALETALCLDKNCQEAYCNLGVVYLRQKDYPKAEQCFRKAIGIQGDYVNAYCNLGKTLAFMNRLSEAVLTYLRVLEIFPTCVVAKSDLAALYLNSSQYESAERYLREAICEDPSMSGNYFNLAQLYKAQQRTQEAIRMLERYQRLEESHESPSAEVKNRLAQVQAELKNLRT